MKQDFCQHFFKLQKSDMGEVVLFSCFDHSRELKRTYKSHLLYEFEGFYKGFVLSFFQKRFTVIITGPGSSRIGDAVLALNGSPCRIVVYTGAAGGINEGVKVGELVAPERAIIGDGFSKYHKKLTENSLFDNYSNASKDLIERFRVYTETKNPLKTSLHFGDIFTTESLFSETESFLARLKKNNIVSIDMETSAFFTAAQKSGFQCMALHYISDLPCRNDVPNIFNSQCKRMYINLPHILIDFIKCELLHE